MIVGKSYERVQGAVVELVARVEHDDLAEFPGLVHGLPAFALFQYSVEPPPEPIALPSESRIRS